MQLEPQEYFTIARGLEDHQDNATYYVRAVIRNARTDELIDTVNLTDNGNRRFTYPWQVPADVSGLGFYILITTTVYTDSGYSTKSELYGERFEEHLVQTRQYHGGGGGSDISYRKVREIVAEELAKLPFSTPQDPDFSPLSDSLQAILAEIRSLDIPKAVPVDYARLEGKIEAVQTAVKAIRIPETDLTELLGLLSDLSGKLQEMKVADISKAAEDINTLLTRIKAFFANDIEEVKTEVSKITKKLNTIPMMMAMPQQEDEE